MPECKSAVVGGVNVSVDDEGAVTLNLAAPRRIVKEQPTEVLVRELDRRRAVLTEAAQALHDVVHDEVFANGMVECNCTDACDGSCTKAKLEDVVRKLIEHI